MRNNMDAVALSSTLLDCCRRLTACLVLREREIKEAAAVRAALVDELHSHTTVRLCNEHVRARGGLATLTRFEQAIALLQRQVASLEARHATNKATTPRQSALESGCNGEGASCSRPSNSDSAEYTAPPLVPEARAVQPVTTPCAPDAPGAPRTSPSSACTNSSPESARCDSHAMWPLAQRGSGAWHMDPAWESRPALLPLPTARHAWAPCAWLASAPSRQTMLRRLFARLLVP